MKTKKVNEESERNIFFDDTLKTDNHMLSIVSKTIGIIGWMIKNFILRETNVWKIYKTIIRPQIE